MPTAERNLIPRDQPHGEATKQEEFIAATEPAQRAAARPVEPNIREFAPQPAQPVADEPLPRMPVDVGAGEIDLASILFAPTERPDEPITEGLGARSQQVAKVSDVLQQLMRFSDSSDVQQLLNEALDLGL